MANPQLQGESMDELFRAILLLENEEECYLFFEDIATISELKALAQRFQVAMLLQNGKTYQQIEGETGASTATISRVKRYLQYGAGGYKLVLSRFDQKG